MKVVLPIFLFPPLEYLHVLQSAKQVILCTGEFFQKQTFRNRYEIATANGKLRMTVPVEGSKNHRNMAEIGIHYRENWPQIHLKSIASAYKNSPFYDYYEIGLQKVLLSNQQNLVQLSLNSLAFLEKGLKTNFKFELQPIYQADYGPEWIDLRNYAFNGSAYPNQIPYLQPFSDRTGFIPNLSGLDLLFCEGPNSLV
jgi:hypothetical protein